MLPKVKTYTETDGIRLFGNTSIQYLDLACKLDVKKEPQGSFAQLSHGMIVRLFENEKDGKFYFEPDVDQLTRADSQLEVSMAESLEVLNGVWLPAPFFRFRAPNRFDEGPGNWARVRMVRLDKPDSQGNTHRITFAFDTKILKVQQGVAYLTPNEDDLNAGAVFRLASSLPQTKWFLDQLWIKEWLVEAFESFCRDTGWDKEDLNRALARQEHIAHYLNVMSFFSGPAPTTHPEIKPRVPLPRVTVKFAHNSGVGSIIPVDLVLDVGNSRTCGLLLEDHGKAGSGLHDHSLLTLRDMSRPEHIYTQPFDSRVEFVKLDFGKPHLSAKSGRHEAFQWASMARVGDEAMRLASHRSGTEGSTGLSSPKRYLWDDVRYEHGWRLNAGEATHALEQEPLATVQPQANLIDDLGEPLFDDMSRLPVFSPCYTRSALMTFMLQEVLAQAVAQINSVLYRSDRPNADTARQLRTIILTVPPGMPLVERTIFKQRVQQAIGLLWISLGWSKGNTNPYSQPEITATVAPGQSGGTPTTASTQQVPVPKVVVKWDEATCGQLVYLYTESVENFGGHPEEFFDVIVRKDKPQRDCLTLASIDIGGGTTDLVINDYLLKPDGISAAGSSNVRIEIKQRFRDGFKVAGDDIVLDVIRHFVEPSFKQAIAATGVSDVNSLIHHICGAQVVGAHDAVLRQQLTLQVFYPIALALLREYEKYDIGLPHEKYKRTYQQWLGEAAVITEPVQQYVNRLISNALERQTTLDLHGIELAFDPLLLHAAFVQGKMAICKTMASLAEVVDQYQCDILLVTGRPSRLPGMQMLVRRQFPLPPGRILQMQNYRTGIWYPFHRAGLIDDPKTSASVGAMIAWLCENRRIPNFYLSVANLRPSAVVRHFGIIDFNNTIKKADVLFSDIPTDEHGRMVLGQVPEAVNEEPPSFPLKGDIRLGYRQLEAERWPGAPLYTLSFEPTFREEQAQRQARDVSRADLEVCVKLKLRKVSDSDVRAGLITDALEVDAVESMDGQRLRRDCVRLELNTMLRTSFAQNLYWLDSGSITL